MMAGKRFARRKQRIRFRDPQCSIWRFAKEETPREMMDSRIHKGCGQNIIRHLCSCTSLAGVSNHIRPFDIRLADDPLFRLDSGNLFAAARGKFSCAVLKMHVDCKASSYICRREHVILSNSTYNMCYKAPMAIYLILVRENKILKRNTWITCRSPLLPLVDWYLFDIYCTSFSVHKP